MNVGTFAGILCMRRDGHMVEGSTISRASSRTQPALALALAIFMFSMAGIPPLAGFFGKLYVFMAAIDAGSMCSPSSACSPASSAPITTCASSR